MRKLFTVLLLLSLIAGQFAMPMKYKCSTVVPSNCINNPWITVSKDDKHYDLTMNVCSNNNQCITLMDKKWNCKDICGVCDSIPAQTGCSPDATCEQKVDAFVNSHCASIIPTTHTTTKTINTTVSGPIVTRNATINVTLTGPTVTTSTTITESEPCPVTSTATCSAQRTLVKSVSTVQPSCPLPTQSTVVKTVTQMGTTNTTTIYVTETPSGTMETVFRTKFVKSIITIQPLCTVPPNILLIDKATSSAREVDSNQTSLFQEVKASSQNKPTIILGALLGLFVVVIVIIIVGWVWTYWNLKINSSNSGHDGETEREYKNPIYDDTSSSMTTILQHKALPGQTTDHANQRTGGDAQVYDVLNRGQTKGHMMARGQGGIYDDEDYSKLGLQDKDIKNNYHLIEN